MHWISPCTLGFIEDAEVVNAAEACANVMHVQSLVISNILTSLKYHNSLSETERRAAPFGNIVGLIPTMTAAITNLANMIGFHTGTSININIIITISTNTTTLVGNIIGIHNSSEIMSGEVERRNLMWQDLRKSVKQNYLREQEKYDEDVRSLNQKYNELMDKISDR